MSTESAVKLLQEAVRGYRDNIMDAIASELANARYRHDSTKLLELCVTAKRLEKFGEVKFGKDAMLGDVDLGPLLEDIGDLLDGKKELEDIVSARKEAKNG